jgi:hypothetical protein
VKDKMSKIRSKSVFSALKITRPKPNKDLNQLPLKPHRSLIMNIQLLKIKFSKWIELASSVQAIEPP